MDSYSEIKIGQKYVLPKGEPFFSIAMQEKVISTRDIVVEITNTVFDKETLFGDMTTVMRNFALEFFIGDSATVYYKKNNGEISFNYKQLKPLK